MTWVVLDHQGLSWAPAVANPAFDVTPHRLITGLITERGVATPAALQNIFGR